MAVAQTTYATRNQLLSEQSTRAGGYSFNFAYDLAQNPTTFKGQSRTYNANNQLIDTGFAYDGNGNPVIYKGVNLAFDPENPIGIEGGINLYAYVGNGVVKGNDPLGLRGLILPRLPLSVLRDIRVQIGACLAGAGWGWISECLYYRDVRPPGWKAMCMGCCTFLAAWDLFKKRYGSGAVRAVCASICGALADMFKHEPPYPPMPPYPSLPPPGVGPQPGDPNRPYPGECIRLPDGRVVCG